MAETNWAAMFAEENRLFEEKRQELYAEHPRKWALVKAPSFIEIHDSEHSAFAAGLGRFGLHGNFMIKQVLLEDVVHCIPSCWTVD